MSDCITIVGKPASFKDFGSWISVSDITNVIETVELSGVSASGKEYTADSFFVDNVSKDQISGLVLHPCGDGEELINRMQNPALGIVAHENGVFITLCGWCDSDDCKTYDEIAGECDPFEDCCSRYRRLRCCLEELMCGREKSSVSYRDRSVSYNRADMKTLRIYVDDLRIECESKMNCGKRSGRRRFRQRIC